MIHVRVASRQLRLEQSVATSVVVKWLFSGPVLKARLMLSRTLQPNRLWVSVKIFVSEMVK